MVAHLLDGKGDDMTRLLNDVSRCPGQTVTPSGQVTSVCQERETCRRYLAGQSDSHPWALWTNYHRDGDMLPCMDKIENLK